MRKLMKSRHSRGSDVALTRISKKGDRDKNYIGQMIFIALAMLPLVSMMCTTLWSKVIESTLFTREQREPYSFDWGEAIEMRSHVSAKYNQLPYLPNGVPRLSAISVSEYRDLWDSKWPVVITDVVPTWGAFHWSKDFLFKFYSKSNITVTQTKGLLKEAEGQVMSLGDFYKLTFDKATATSWAYATDEHFISHHAQLKLDIGTNKYAEEDYFSYLPDEVRPKNAMLLWGTKYSRSKLHVDPYNWTGTIALLSGTKRWKLWPPNPENTLGLSLRRSGLPLDCPTLVSNRDSFSQMSPAKNGGGDRLDYSVEFDQKPGDLLFIPTGWAHQVISLSRYLKIKIDKN
ncbi:bifunctional arginine demethylase and lysyl-hydroxylase psr-1-like isoform X2 [Watersipora subatra]|uniref:bifunctional arginine demethylase and lysyl-hydroxylase psr-1-like isoform X2 n=1 Tax=Watersipora subatra TaxID=2589382 RepID=UPI00355C362D